MSCCGKKTGVVVDSKAKPQAVKLDRRQRTKCPDCVLKHAAYAYVAMTEVAMGYPEHIELAVEAIKQSPAGTPLDTEELSKRLEPRWKAIGHLVHAEEEAPQNLAMLCRNKRLRIMEHENPDMLPLLEEIEKVRLANKDVENG